MAQKPSIPEAKIPELVESARLAASTSNEELDQIVYDFIEGVNKDKQDHAEHRTT